MDSRQEYYTLRNYTAMAYSCVFLTMICFFVGYYESGIMWLITLILWKWNIDTQKVKCGIVD